MIKNLIAAAIASILITQPPQNTNDGTYYQDVNITETYEYETNDVNSVNDLVVGNIYKVDLTNLTENTTFILYYSAYNIEQMDVYNTFSSSNLTVPRLYITSTDNPNYKGYFVPYSSNNTAYGYIVSNLVIDIVFTSYSGNIDISLISASDYLGEKTITVERVETEGLYNLAYHFLYSRIYTNTELQGMETTLFGNTINMNMWLSHTTAIIIICLLLIVLIKFVIWLFKIVSGGMLWQ